MARKKRTNPRGDPLQTALLVGLIGGGAYVAYRYVKTNPSKVANIVTGQPTWLPNGTANPAAEPWKTDTGYKLSPY